CRILDEALTLARQTTEGLYEAELYRLRGEMALGDPNGKERAGHDFERARELARRQSAKSLELRATLSLVRLGADRARERLARLYRSFGDVSDTTDLREARRL